ncbi:calcium-binding protein, partial [Candidatus Parcubacteria bacterium]|nr:calcium-binding protein [Candidatus Parcubacteria bacterium]
MAGNELFIQGKKFISLKRASELSGYAKDYIGQLCRCGKIKSERIGRDWFVDLEGLLCYKKNKIESTEKILQQKEIAGKIDSQNKDISSRRAIELEAIKDSWDKELFEGSAERKFTFIPRMPQWLNLRLAAKFVEPLAYGFAVILLIFGFVRYSSKAGEIYAQWVQPTGEKIASELYNIGSDVYLATIYSTGDALASFSFNASGKTVALLNKISAPEIHPVRNFYGALDFIKTYIVLTKNFASEKILAKLDLSDKLDKLAQLEIPEIKIPDIKIPEFEIPKVRFPEIVLPKINFSRFVEVSLPEINPVRNFYGALDFTKTNIVLTKNFASEKISNISNGVKLPEIALPKINLSRLRQARLPDGQGFGGQAKIVLALANVQHLVLNKVSNITFSISEFGIGAKNNLALAGSVFSSITKNIFTETKNSFALFPQNVKEIAMEFLGLPSQTGLPDRQAGLPRSELAINENYNESVYQQEINSLKLELSQIKNKGLAVQSPIVQKTIVEKSVEKIILGLTSEEIDARLNEVNEKLMAQILDVKNKLAYRTDSIANATVASTYQAVALTNKIDSLSGVTINNATFTGTLGGLTDAMIPDSITASNYLLLSGGTITGALTVTATTTFNGVAYGWPSADGSANYVLSTNGAGVLSWVAQTGGGGTINQLGQIGDVSTSTLAYGHLLMWNGVDTWQDTATSSLGITSGITSLNGQTGATQTFATSSDTDIGVT